MTLTAGFSKVCESSSGGLLEVHLANVDDVTSFTLTGEDYTAVTMVATKVFYKFEFEQDTAEYRENVERSDTGAVSATHEVEFQITKMTSASRAAIQEIMDASPCGLIAIVKDGNGNQWTSGYSEVALLERPMRIASDTSATGKAFTDSNASIVMLSSVDGEKARVFTGTVPV